MVSQVRESPDFLCDALFVATQDAAGARTPGASGAGGCQRPYRDTVNGGNAGADFGGATGWKRKDSC